LSHTILLLGKNGQLGWELQRTLAPLGKMIALDYPDIDFTKTNQLEALISEQKPDLIVNAAAYTEVDRAEREVETARLVNGIAPGILAAAARRLNAVFVHYSTDYVFDGAKNQPYLEEDVPHPLGVYGQSKLEGEQAVKQVGEAFFIFRTCWVYSMRQGGFVNKVLQWSRQKKSLRLVTDQVSNPTWCRMLAETTANVIAMGRSDLTNWAKQNGGLFHLAGRGYTSRFEWAKLILELDPKRQEQIVEELLPAQTIEFPAPAERPLFSALDCSLFERTFDIALPQWDTAMRLMLDKE
jgi:dTDP-4-dehydrorhamnose reductase